MDVLIVLKQEVDSQEELSHKPTSVIIIYVSQPQWILPSMVCPLADITAIDPH